MAPNNRPGGRERNITGTGKVEKRGEGLGTGPVGTGPRGNSAGKPSVSRSTPSRDTNNGQVFSGLGGSSSSTGGSKKKKSPLLTIILIVVVIILISRSGMFSGTTSDYSSGYSNATATPAASLTTAAPQTSTQTGSSASSLLSNVSTSYTGAYASGSSSGWALAANTGKLDETVVKGARDKFTEIKGNGKDTVTIMVYMCGTDLESSSGLATSDLQEMASATLSDKVNVLIYTGGCRQWKNNIISSSKNQIYKLESGGAFKRLESDMGSVSMTKPSTLTTFIDYCTKNYSANRNMLILWDHGGGSVSGYGYDEKYSSSGSMSLKGIKEALDDADTTFDFIGFDACLMGAVENALMLTDYADYLIASEETEPGYGWYYKNWLSLICSNTSAPTIQVGRQIVDDFIETCASQARGQAATLSVVDLAELDKTIPSAFKEFAEAITEMVNGDEYKTVSNARVSAREFSSSSRVDQVDLVSFANGLGTDEANQLAEAVLGAVKYNRTSSGMTNAYGLSVYFPYRMASYVSTAVSTYNAIGVDSAYSECIQAFAGTETAGQAATGGTNYGLSSLFEDYYSGYGSSTSSGSSGSSSSYGWDSWGSSDYSGWGSSSYSGWDSLTSGSSSGSYQGYGYSNGYSSSTSSYSDVLDILSGLMGGSSSYGVSGYSSGSAGSYWGRSINPEATAQYISENLFDNSKLVWTETAEGTKVISLSEDQWGLVQDLDLSVYIDDGEGFIDLGLDNIFSFNDSGELIGEYDGAWMGVNGQPVAYYRTESFYDGENYRYSGYIPCLINGEYARLIVVFDNENPNGYIASVEYEYREGETETIAKSRVYFGEATFTLDGDNATATQSVPGEILVKGDKIDFICDYYTYEGEYQDTFCLGSTIEYNGELTVGDLLLENADAARAMYRFTDIYNQQYWTPVIH